ncbi:MAG: hypothetical protein M3463_06565, partial [Verrucomicrobiota bacterium]|nr:hypothetical protein [Verrucomicrobiota bacterium]
MALESINTARCERLAARTLPQQLEQILCALQSCQMIVRQIATPHHADVFLGAHWIVNMTRISQEFA